MAAPPATAAEFVQRVTNLVEWIHPANENVRIEVVTALLRACRLAELPTIRGNLLRIFRCKSVLRDNGRQYDGFPNFALAPHMGIQFPDDAGDEVGIQGGGENNPHEGNENLQQVGNVPVPGPDEGFEDEEHGHVVHEAHDVADDIDLEGNQEAPEVNDVDDEWDEEPAPGAAVPAVPENGNYADIMYWLSREYPNDRRRFLNLAINCCRHDYELRFIRHRINFLIWRRHHIGFLGWEDEPLP